MKSAKQRIADILETAIGLKVTTIGNTTFERTIAHRMKILGLSDVPAYTDRLSASSRELRALVEEVVIPETWFFRDKMPFKVLADHIMNSGRNLEQTNFRILSLPCSTGEEPYSIVMALLQAGLPPSSFHVDAVDVSERVLTLARQAVYRENSFRTEDLGFRDIFFYKAEKGFTLKNSVREKVHFMKGNILHPAFMECLGRYGIIFCRNVLIYFNEESQRQAIKALYQLLLPEGILFTGHAEAGLFLSTRFIPYSRSGAFAFYKDNQRRDRGFRPPSINRDDAADFSATVPAVDWQSMPFSARSSSAVFPDKGEKEFRQVQKLADEGNLKEAGHRSEQYLSQHGPSAKWYYLLGVIRDSEGQRDEALKLLRKAVYLDPGHVESLIQLSLLAERSGDFDKAENYKRRAKRLREGGDRP